MAHNSLGDFKGISMSPFGLAEMKSQLITLWRRIHPRLQTAAPNEFIGLFFKDRPVLNTVLFLTDHLGFQLFLDLLPAQYPSKKSHHFRIAPKRTSTLQIGDDIPSSKPKSVCIQNVHESH